MNSDIRTLERIRDTYARRVTRLERALNRHVTETTPELVVRTIQDLQEARARHRALENALTAARGRTP